MFSKISLVFLYILLVTVRTFSSDKISIYQNKIIDDISSRIKNIANNTYSYITKNENRFDITQQCLSAFSYILNNANLLSIAVEKFIMDSAKMSNDISNYKDCLYGYGSFTDEEDVEFIRNKMTYVIFTYNVFKGDNPFRKENITLSKKTIFGMCLPKGCTNKDYENLFNIVSSKIIYFTNEKSTKFSGLSAYSIYDKENITFTYLLHFVPFLVIVIFFSLTLFSNMLCCKRAKGTINNNKNKSNFFLYYKQCFSLGENCEEISKSRISLYDTNLFNETGLSVFNGLLSFAIILIIIGTIFETFYLSPLTNNKRYLMSIFTQPNISFIIFAQRFGKKLCYCISSITLVYKFLSYLDGIMENKQTFSTSRTLIDQNNNYLTNLNSNKAYIKFHKSLKWKKSFFLFVVRIFYKYIMLWMFALMYKFSFYYVVNFFFNSAPFWIYFNNTILKKFSLTTLFGVEFISSPKKLVEYTRTNPFKIIINEINCYILMTICIFWFYKHNLHFDIFIFSAILSLLGGKFYVFNDWYVHNKMKLSPAKSFMFTVNNYLMNSTSYNLIYFAIGLMIGLLNYCIQKSNLRKSKKKWIRFPFFILSHFQQKNKKSYCYLLVSIFTLIFIIFSYYFLFHIFCFLYTEHSIKNFLNNYYINLFYLYDNEIALICLFYIVFYFFYSTDSRLIFILKGPFWTFISRPYYTTMLNCGIVSYYILYQNDAKITADNAGFFFYSVIGIFFVFIVSMICFILIEVPMKKMTKLIMLKCDRRKKNVIVSSSASGTERERSESTEQGQFTSEGSSESVELSDDSSDEKQMNFN